jgi:hypothetical protein
MLALLKFDNYIRWCAVDVKDFVKKDLKWTSGDQRTSNSCIYMQQNDDFIGDVLLGKDDCMQTRPFVCEVKCLFY